jgi:2,4-didehydro-3-deoxy-L-rhamnonate hydrolase
LQAIYHYRIYLVVLQSRASGMKLIRIGPVEKERPAVLLHDQTRIDVSQCTADYDEAFFAHDGIARLEQWLRQHASSAPRLNSSERLGPPISRPGKIICVGLNYRAHAAESKLELPGEPVLFCKATSSVAGANDCVVMPRGGEKLDYEVELAVVIGKKASCIARERALKHVAGYVLANDYSERSFQFERGGQWIKGKSCDSFAPLGPFLATPDEVPDPGRLNMWLKVNGEDRQRGTTADMIFDVPFLVSYVSQFMTLFPADVISTGTPPGVAFGMRPPQYLKPGDVVEYGIDNLGGARQQVVAWSPER